MLMAKKVHFILLLAIVFTTGSTEAQFPDCYFQEVNLVPCLTSEAAGKTSEICCQALNQALSAGQKCLCAILFSTNLFLDSRNPIPTSPQGIELPGCNLFMLSLSTCQEMLDLTKTTPPDKETNSTAATVSSPTASKVVPKSSKDINEHAPVREGQKPMDLVSQPPNIDQSRISSAGPVHVISNVLRIACILLTMSVQAFYIMK